MATYYGNNVSNTYSGTTYTWKNLTDYTYTETATTFTVTFKVKFYLVGGQSTQIGLSRGNFSAFLNIDGTEVSSFVSTADHTLKGGEANAWEVISYSQTYTKTHSAQTKTVATQCKGVAPSNWKGTSDIAVGTITITIPAQTSYAVTYNNNGGTGTIANGTKWYGESLTLSDGTGFTRNNHDLVGWNTAANGSGTHYALGGTYTANAAVTLYAEWVLSAVTGYARVSGSIKTGIFYARVNGNIVTPHLGYVKVGGVWEQII